MVYYKTIKDFYFNIPKPLVLLGLDYGKKKIGVSISDKNNTMALVHKIIYQDKDNAIEEIIEIIKQLSITGIVIGYPLETSGNEGDACKSVIEFCNKLSSKIEIPIFLQDERFSTKIIGQALRSTKVKTKRMNQIEDSLAAVNILQTTLDQIKSMLF